MANNGDGARLMCQLGAAANGPPVDTKQWSYVRFRYEQVDPEATCTVYRTTQLVQLRLTAWVHSLLDRPGVVDLREVVVADCVLAGLALATMAWLLRGSSRWWRVVVLAAMFAVLADATFADYAASPYSEPAAFIGLTGVALAGVAVSSGRRRGVALLVAVLAAVLAVGAKVSTAVLALPLAAPLVTSRLEVRRLRGRVGSRVLPSLGAAAVLATGVWVTIAEVPWYEQVNVNNVITDTIMPQSSDPGRVATDFGLPSSFGRYSGTNWWSPEPLRANPDYRKYRHLMTRRHLARYLADHPAVAGRMVTGGARDYLAFRVDYLGTYGPDSGAPPRALECRLCLLPAASHAVGRAGLAGIVAFWAACLALAIALIRMSAPGTPRRGFARAAVALLGCAIVQYVTVVFGDGVELTKHHVVGLFAAALVPVWLLAAAVARSRPDDAAAPAAEPRSADLALVR